VGRKRKKKRSDSSPPPKKGKAAAPPRTLGTEQALASKSGTPDPTPPTGTGSGAAASAPLPSQPPQSQVQPTDDVETVVDRPPFPDEPTVTHERSRPFTIGSRIEVDDDGYQSFVDQALHPEGDRMLSFGEFARGGMGVIERIVDRVLQRQAAAKVMRYDCRCDEGTARAFVREAQITGQLDHPNIVPIYDLGSTVDGRLCFTMKLVEGVTLSRRIEQLPRGPIERSTLLDFIDVLLRVCDALAFAHSRGVVHCDLKPGNVMVADYGQVYLMDWGIAQLLAEPSSPDGRQVACSVDVGERERVLGTPSYMSPEQAFGQRVDRRTDVFAVGALLYTILCRRPPYSARDSSVALRAARRCDFVSPDEAAPGVPRELNRIVLKAMDLHPGRRYPTIVDLQQDLLRFMRGGGDFPRVEFAKGELIVREGEVGDAAFIIEKGRCRVFKEVDGKEVHLREMGPGEVFGETAILAASPRTASVVALERTVLLAVTRDVLEQELGAMKPWMSAFIRTLAERFRERESKRKR
jgi:serine/threonine-protein kinase